MWINFGVWEGRAVSIYNEQVYTITITFTPNGITASIDGVLIHLRCWVH